MKMVDVLLNGLLRFSVFFGIFLVVFSFHPWCFLVFFVSVFFVGVLSFSNRKKVDHCLVGYRLFLVLATFLSTSNHSEAFLFALVTFYETF